MTGETPEVRTDQTDPRKIPDWSQIYKEETDLSLVEIHEGNK